MGKEVKDHAVICKDRVLITFQGKEHILTGFDRDTDDDWWNTIDNKDVNVVSGESFGVVNPCGWDVVLYGLKEENGSLVIDTEDEIVLPTTVE